MKPTLHLVEPTLHDLTGHSFTYVDCISRANTDFACHIWCDRRGHDLSQALRQAVVHPIFWRPLRQLQKLWLYRTLLRQPGVVLISTAALWDLRIICALLAKPAYRQATPVLHFHQFTQTAAKQQRLTQLARLHPDLHVITPTAALTDIFMQAGFKRCQTLACPTYATATAARPSAHATFSKLLYAGAARADKGFPQVVAFVKHCVQANLPWQFEIQVSPPNSGRYDAPTAAALEQLEQLPTTHVTLHRHTLSKAEYLGLFKGAICLLIYEPAQYRDKFSALALDAFYAGAPILTCPNTWMGNQADSFQAGLTLANYQPETMIQGVQTLIQDYPEFAARAQLAGAKLRQLHDPQRTLDYLQQIWHKKP